MGTSDPRAAAQLFTFLSANAGRVVTTLVFRLFPVVVYAIFTKETRILGKSAIVSLAVAGVWHIGASLYVMHLAFAYVYLASVSCVMPTLATLLRRRRVHAWSVFVACACLYFVVPAAACPRVAKSIMVVLGWDMTLSGYSYCREVSRTPNNPPWSETLFFLLVNPALVYTERGRRIGTPNLDVRGLLRSALGLIGMFATNAILKPSYQVLAQSGRGALKNGAPIFLVASAGAWFLMIYVQQSGLASLQIGLIRQIGFEIPERYFYPLAATNLPDFWRRWNTYVGHWLLRYVFWPAALSFRRKWQAPSIQGLLTGLSLVLAFLTAGALHDAFGYAGTHVVSVRNTVAFLVNGLCVVLAVAGQRLSSARAPKSLGPTPAGGVAARFVLWATLLASVVWWYE